MNDCSFKRGGGDLFMNYTIKKAAVLGSGVMGSGIAAHLANIGIPTILLDIVPKELTKTEEAKGLTFEHPQVRNRFATQALERLVKQKPAPLTSKKICHYYLLATLRMTLKS